MSEADQIKHFADDLDRLVDRYREEYQITYAGVVGILAMKMYLLCQESKENEE